MSALIRRDAHRESFLRLAKTLARTERPRARKQILEMIDEVLDIYLRDRLKLGLRDMEAWGLIEPAIMYFAGELADTPHPQRVGYLR